MGRLDPSVIVILLIIPVRSLRVVNMEREKGKKKFNLKLGMRSIDGK